MWIVRVLASGVVLTSAGEALAQSPPPAPEAIPVGDWRFSPSVELRTRGELRIDPVDVGGNGTPVVHDQGVVFERARLGLGVDKGAIHAQVTLQDTYVWGSPGPLSLGGSPPCTENAAACTSNVFVPFEAYVEAHTSGARPNYFRLGRQPIELGDGRILGVSDWAPFPVALDAARLHLTKGAIDFDAIAALLDTPRPFGAEFGDVAGPSAGGDQLYAAQLNFALFPLLRFQLYGVAKIARYDITSTARNFADARAVGETYTGAARLHGDGSGWKWAVEGAYQVGHLAHVNLGPQGLDRQAYAAAAYVTKTLERVMLTPTLRLGVSYASGDDGTGSTYKQFDPILPDVHSFQGAMDIFAWSNIIDPNIRVTVVPFPETTAAVEYRYAMMANAQGEWVNGYLQSVGQAPGNTSTELGHEIDGVVTWLPWPSVSLVMGYSMFVLGDGARAVLASVGRGDGPPSGPFNVTSLSHFAYLQATLRVP